MAGKSGVASSRPGRSSRAKLELGQAPLPKRSWLLAQNALLAMTAAGAPIEEVLHCLVSYLEIESVDSWCSILLLRDSRLWTAVAPSLPRAYSEALSGTTIGLGVGSCGNTAFTEQPTIVEDIATHRFWRDYRELARLNEGKIGLHKEPIGVAELLKLAVKQTASLGKSRGHRLHLDAAPEPLVLDADPVRIVQVIANLLGNAAKYTPAHGERWVSAAARDGGVELVVRDSGIGIAPQVLERIFDLYAQLDLPPVGMHGGLGIGLSLVKSLAEMHDGRVTAESEGPGHGGRFRVWLPAFTERLPDEQTTTAA